MSIIGAGVGAVLPKHNHDTDYLKLSGGSMTGPLNMKGQALMGLAEPENDTDAAAKGYVDAKIAGVDAKIAGVDTKIAGMRTTCTVTLEADGWEDSRQTVAVAGVTADSDVDVSPSPEGYTTYCEAGVYCSAQADGSLTFVCTSVPTDDLSVNVRIWN